MLLRSIQDQRLSEPMKFQQLRYLVAVAGDAYEIDDDSDDFNDALFFTLALLGIAFVLTVWFQVRFGLRPLTRISEALSAVRSGRTEKLEGKFPEEIAPGSLHRILDQLHSGSRRGRRRREVSPGISDRPKTRRRQ